MGDIIRFPITPTSAQMVQLAAQAYREITIGNFREVGAEIREREILKVKAHLEEAIDIINRLGRQA